MSAGWFDRLAAVIPLEPGLVSLAIAGCSHIARLMAEKEEEIYTNCSKVRSVMAQPGSGLLCFGGHSCKADQPLSMQVQGFHVALAIRASPRRDATGAGWVLLKGLTRLADRRCWAAAAWTCYSLLSMPHPWWPGKD